MRRVPLATTLEIRDRCLCLAAQRAARVLAKRFDAALRGVALTNGQFSLLMALNQGEPPTIGSVAKLLAMDRTTLTAALKPLEKRALVKVTVDKADKRGRRLQLTDAGQAQLLRALPIWRREHARVDRLIGSPIELHEDLVKLSRVSAESPDD